MFERLFVACTAFIALLSIFGIYLGYWGLIYPSTGFLAVLVSLILAYRLSAGKGTKVENRGPLLGLLTVFLLVLAILSLPYLIFPHGAGDFANHATSVRITAKNHQLVTTVASPEYLVVFPHVYPNIYYAVASTLYSLYPHTYVVTSVFAIILELLSLIGLFLIAKTLFDERIALLSTFISGFAITNLFVLEQGFFPYIIGQFFFIASVYSYLVKDKKLMILSNAGLFSYPHAFGIYLVFLTLETLKTREWKNFIIPVVSLCIIAPETIGFVWERIFVKSQASTLIEPFRGSLLVRGGILTPTLFSLVIFVFAVLGFYKERKNRGLINFNLSIVFLIGATLVAFGYDYLMGYTKDLHLLYMAPKLFYLLVFPLSIAAAVGLSIIRRKDILLIILALYGVYFAGYAFMVLPTKASFSGEFYEVAEKLDTMPGEFKVGVDPELGTNVGWKARFPYKSLIDLPDEGYTLDTVELNRALHFHWASRIRTKDGPLVVDSKGELVVGYSSEGVTYYITSKSLDRPVVFKEGQIKVYGIENGLSG
jgi:hypothetical protein